jgi:hypothetical protein
LPTLAGSQALSVNVRKMYAVRGVSVCKHARSRQFRRG